MKKCPNCNSTISLGQIMKHSTWTPIICKNCNTKLHFNRKSWFKIVTPVIVIMSLLLLVTIFDIKSILLYGALTFLLIYSFIKFLFDLKSIKLEEQLR